MPHPTTTSDPGGGSRSGFDELPASPEARVSIETPEHVEFLFDLAGGGSRFLAVLIDSLIQVFVAVPLLFTLFFTTSLPELEGFAVILIIVLVFLWNGYFVFFEILWHGQTPGKRIFKLRVVKDAGVAVTALDTLIRNVVRVVDFLPMGYLVGAASVFLTHNHKRLGDFAAGTIVVKERSPVSLEEIEARAVALDREPVLEITGVERLEPEEVRFLRRFVGRAVHLDPAIREEIERNLAARLRDRIEVAGGEPVSDAQLVEEIYLTYVRERSR